MKSLNSRTPDHGIVTTDDHDQSPGWNYVQLTGGRSAGQLVSVHVEQAEHTTPDGETHHRTSSNHFVAASMLGAMFGGGK